MPGFPWSRGSCAAVLLAVSLSIATATPARAGETRVAVAANFAAAAREIGARFAAETGHEAVFSFGATGALYAQISQQAPFDVFLAADQARPEQAVAEGFAVAGTRFTYATGRLALFSRDAGRVRGAETLNRGGFAKLAIANPATAPYGAAAVQTLKALGVYDALVGQLVRGEDVAQAYQFVETGNAELGLVALSQIVRHHEGSRWIVPDSLHDPIAQDAVLLTRGAKSEAARAFLSFLNGRAARSVVDAYGYGTGG